MPHFLLHRGKLLLRVLFPKKLCAGKCARERLDKVLLLDRTGETDDLRKQIQTDILAVLSNYAAADVSLFEIEYTRIAVNGEKRQVPSLIARIPLRYTKE